MSIEIIKAIRETEEKAESIKKQAAQQSKQIIADANVQAVGILDEARNFADSESSKLLKAAEEEGQKLYDDIVNNAAKECKNILINADEQMDKAASIILERMMKPSGNS